MTENDGFAPHQSTGPRTRRARMMFWLALPVGAALSLILIFGSPAGPQRDPFGDGPIPQGTAWLAIGVWIAAFVGSWLWWRNIDEHEAQAYTFGGLVAVHFYFFTAPTWWIGWRGGFLPEPNHIGVLAATAFVWCIVWFWRRYR